MQIDLRSYFKLKCIKIPVRSYRVFDNGYFHDIEFRFGNESRDGDFAKNPIILYTGPRLEGAIFEFCLDIPLVGKYLLLFLRNPQAMLIGEIQILVI